MVSSALDLEEFTPEQRSAANRRAAFRLAVLFGAAAFVLWTLAVLVITFWLSPWIAPIAGLVVAVGWVIFAWKTGVPSILDTAEVEPADVKEHARYFNMANALSVTVGVSPPKLYLVDDDGINAMALGMNSREASVVVTRGLLDTLEVVELEAVLALVFQRIKSQQIVVDTFVVSSFGSLALIAEHLDNVPSVQRLFESTNGLVTRILARLHSADDEFVADIEASVATRYPPALASALQKMDGKSALTMGSPVTAHLWLAPPVNVALRPDAAGMHKPISERVAVLQEL